jgi:N-methylhydantoinase A
MKSKYRVAVDVGGTFMDFVLMDEETGTIRVEKAPSLADKLPSQFIKGMAAFDIPMESIGRIFHGMTVGVNALLQERGARVGLITTRGFRDVLEMGRGGRKPVYNFTQKNPVPIVERSLRREVTERLNFKGDVLKPIDLNELDREVDYLLSQGVEAIAVTFLHAYAHPSHEIAARDRIMERHPHIPVSVSHEIASEWREYERTSTTVLNAFIQPVVKGYLDELQDKLGETGYDGSLGIMQSSGGVANTETASTKPIRTLMSGPAGGVIGAKFLCGKLGYENVICTDVGGTSYEVAIIENGNILERSQTEIARRPILSSLIDVASIGAGGGSIAWLDHRGGLQVGPQSAGATPGPVCFGNGGTEPTTTDAHLVLGRLDPDYFLGGRMQLDIEGARKAIDEKIATPLGISIEKAASGIVRIAETNMANAIRTKTVARGLDPREFVSLAYGGGGGLFACAVADELEVPRVIVPVAPANFSAWGILTSDYIEDEVRTRVGPFNGDNIGKTMQVLDELTERALKAVEGYGFARPDIELLRRLDLRFENQEYTITVDLEPEWTDADSILKGAREKFAAAHMRLYGHGDADANMEQVSVRCRAIGRVRAPEVAKVSAPTEKTPSRTRMTYFDSAGQTMKTEVVSRDSLGPGDRTKGPAIVEEWTMTTIVPPNWSCVVDDYGNLILEPSHR